MTFDGQLTGLGDVASMVPAGAVAGRWDLMFKLCLMDGGGNVACTRAALQLITPNSRRLDWFIQPTWKIWVRPWAARLDLNTARVGQNALFKMCGTASSGQKKKKKNLRCPHKGAKEAILPEHLIQLNCVRRWMMTKHMKRDNLLVQESFAAGILLRMAKSWGLGKYGISGVVEAYDSWTKKQLRCSIGSLSMLLWHQPVAWSNEPFRPSHAKNLANMDTEHFPVFINSIVHRWTLKWLKFRPTQIHSPKNLPTKTPTWSMPRWLRQLMALDLAWQLGWNCLVPTNRGATNVSFLADAVNIVNSSCFGTINHEW